MRRQQFVLLILGFLFGFILLEGMLRASFTGHYLKKFFWPYLGFQVTDCRSSDSEFHHILLANCKGVVAAKGDFSVTFTTNSFGMRNQEIKMKKPKDTFRILVLGDSFTEGWGVNDNDTYSAIMQSIFMKQQKKIEVLNAGVGSYSPYLELHYLVKKGIALDPDLVIMMVSTNDLHDDYLYGGWEAHLALREKILPNTHNAIPKPMIGQRTNMNNLLGLSKSFSYMYTHIKSHYDTKHEQFSYENLSHDNTINVNAAEWKGYEDTYNLVIANLLLTRDFLRKTQVPFIVTTDSRGMYHNGKEWVPGRTVWGYETGKTYDPKPIKIIAKAAQKYNIPYIDMYGALQQSNATPLYYATDGHWTAKAHKVVGQTIAHALTQGGFIK